MTRESYLRLKYWSNDPFLNLVRTGFFVFLCGALYITLVDLAIVLWTSYRLVFAGLAR